MEGRPFDLVDATDLDFATVDGIRRQSSLGWMRVQDILASDLYARRRPVSLDERRTASEAWSRLRCENAPFRIVQDGRLVSAPLTHYDALRRTLGGTGQPAMEIAIRLIGRVVTTFHDAPTGDGTDGDLLFGRSCRLERTVFWRSRGRSGHAGLSGPHALPVTPEGMSPYRPLNLRSGRMRRLIVRWKRRRRPGST